MTDSHAHRIVLLSTSFRYPKRWLFFARARLYFDRIELSGWLFGAKHGAPIRRDEIEGIEWRLMARSASEPNAIFHLRDGRLVALVLNDVHRWQDMLEERLGWNVGRLGGRCVPVPALFGTVPDLPFHDFVAYASSMS